MIFHCQQWTSVHPLRLVLIENVRYTARIYRRAKHYSKYNDTACFVLKKIDYPFRESRLYEPNKSISSELTSVNVLLYDLHTHTRKLKY
jgi:hypothetical protein